MGSGGSTSKGGSGAAQGGKSNPSGGQNKTSGGSSQAGNGGTQAGGASNNGGQNGANGGTSSTNSGGSGTNGGSSNGGSQTSNGGSNGNSNGGNSNGGNSNGGSGTNGGSSNAGSSNAGSSAGGAAGNTALGGSGGGTGQDCGSLPLCDTFESSMVGSALDSKLWTLIPTGTAGTATIDSTGAHGSSKSLKVVSPDRLYLRNSSVIGTLGDTVHVRFYVRFASALAQGHGAMIVTHPTMVDQYSQQNELRFGSQDNVFHWNTDSDAANVPDVSPNGDTASFKPVANMWYCIELTINTGGNLSASIDGTDVAGLAVDGTPTANIDQSWLGSSASLSRYKMLADFNFGWQSYGAGAMTLWFDDIALSKTHIGCQ